MSAIDKLKNNITIDAAGDSSSNNEFGVSLGNNEIGASIDATTNGPDRVNLTANTKRNKHKVVLPKGSAEASPTVNTTVNPAARRTISIDQIAQPEPEDPNIHESYEKDILDPDDPNSMFRQYADAKQKEMEEWIVEQAEKKALEAQEAAENGEELLEETHIPTRAVYDPNDDIPVLDDEDEDDEEFEDEEDIETDMADYDVDTDLDIPDDNDEELSEDEEEDDLGEDSEEDEVEETPAEPKKDDKPKSYKADIDMEVTTSNDSFTEEVEDEEDDDIDDTDDKEILEHLKELAKERLKPAASRLDLSSFTVVQQASTNITPIFKATTAKVSKWVLPEQQSVVLMKEFSGAELEQLREYSEDSSFDAQNRKYKMIYDHIVSPKPASYELWAQTTPAIDMDHYFFAVYCASFKGANFLPIDCPNDKCRETFLSDNMEIMDMVKFDSKKAKKKFTTLYKSEPAINTKGLYTTEIIPISDKVAIGFRQAPIYDIIQVASLLSRNVQAQYSAFLNYVPYIDKLYQIDQASHQLIPIDYKHYPENKSKDLRSKLAKYNNVFNTMTADEFGIIGAYVTELADRNSGMSYVVPAITCPKCNTATEEQEISGETLVFTRHRLAALVSTSLS